MNEITHEEAIKQLKEAISKIKDVESFTLEQTFIYGDAHYDLNVKSTDGIPYHLFLGIYSSIDCYIDMHGVDNFCDTICEDIKLKFRIERGIKNNPITEKYVVRDAETLKEAFKNIETND